MPSAATATNARAAAFAHFRHHQQQCHRVDGRRGIAEIARQTLAADFRYIDPRTARIVPIEAGPRPYCRHSPTEQSDYVRTALGRAGVEVKTDTRVTKCDAQGVDFEVGRIDAGTTIWAAGVVASPAARWLDAEADRAGRVKVGPDLSVPALEHFRHR